MKEFNDRAHFAKPWKKRLALITVYHFSHSNWVVIVVVYVVRLFANIFTNNALETVNIYGRLPE